MLLTLVTAITAALAVERILHACISLIFYLFDQGPDRKSAWFVGSLVQSLIATVGAIISAFLRLFSFSFRSIVWWIVVLFLWGFLYACGQYSAEAMLAFQYAYNTQIGGGLRLAFSLPLQIMQLLWDGIIPIYNLSCYLATTVPTRVLLENALRNWQDLQQSMLNLSLFFAKLSASTFTFVRMLLSPPTSFDPNLRLLDLVTPLAYFRLAVSYLLAWLGQTCAVATSLLDVLFYPFLDINFGLGAHSLINSVLTLLQVPAVTIQRCRAGSSVVYCLPDFEPVFELAVNGVRSLGQLADNWLDVTSLIIQSVLTNTNPACTGWTVANFGEDQALFGNNATTIVGVDTGLFAKTDGWSIALYSRTGMRSFIAAFPFAARIAYGIGVVSITPSAKGLLGCTCTDQAWGLQLLCGVAPLDGLTDPYIVPVEFDVPTTSFYMGCGRASIRLESIRWPVTRYTSPNAGARPSPMAEAALYVRPSCSSEHIDVACIETFKLSNCFPYCMALWTKGYIGSMILRGGDEWSSTVAMVARDCGLHSWDVQSGQIAAMTQTLRANSGVRNAWMDAEVQLNSSHCVYAPNTFSRMLRNVSGAYSAYRSVLLTGQPFAFAGDLILTAVNTVGDTWGVDVQRVWGNQVISPSRACLKRSESCSLRGPHFSSSSMHRPMRSSGRIFCARSSSSSRSLSSI